MPNETPVEHHTPPARARRRLQSASETRRHRRRLAGYGLFAASLVLMVHALVGENGYLATVRAQHEVDAIERELSATRIENQALQDRIRRLKTDPAALEEAARRDLGLIKPGETVIILKDRAAPPPTTAPRRR